MAFGLHPTQDQPISREIRIDRSFRSEPFRTVTPDGFLGIARQPPSANGLLPSAYVKMKAIPQKPGPNGSRVVKKRPSLPRLGDGLANLLARSSNATDDLGLSGLGRKCSVCAGDEAQNIQNMQNHVPTSDLTASSPSVVLDQVITVLPGKEEIKITTSPGTAKPEKSGRNRSKVNGVMETPVARNKARIARRSKGKEVIVNASWDTTPTMNSPTQSATRASSQEREASFTSSDESPFDSLSVSSGDGVALPSDTSISCTPREDSEEDSISLYVKKRSNRMGLDETPSRCKPIVNYVEHSEFNLNSRSPATVKATRASQANDAFLSIKAEKSTITFEENFVNTQGPSYQVAFDPAAAKMVQTEADILNSYDRGEITLSEAKKAAIKNQFRVLLVVLEEREKQLLAASTLAHCTKNMGEVDTRHADQIGLGHNIVPTSMPNPSLEWTNLTLLPQNPVTVYVEEDRFRSFTSKLRALSFQSHNTSAEKPVHIFVDMSNIFIGFCDSWKIRQGIPVNQFIKAPPFNFKVFSAIMQRGRVATKKILAGSVGGAVSERAKWPRHFNEAVMAGYEMNIFSRVQKSSTAKPRRRGRTPPQINNMYNAMELGITSGDESLEDVGPLKAGTRHAEQGVDENLHLNMMNSMLDCMDEPETMVLATGDAAQAQFSGGFMEYATRALNRGWNLELITWRKTISSAWTAPAFLKKYSKQFRIIFLDEYLEELNADLACLSYGFESQWA
ncbi:hypothetical protein F4810DRAFT_57262 [Camillea tinctor]|nr:hypothetical protein F4810DRAFT_57262 [Camillea tinctor]